MECCKEFLIILYYFLHCLLAFEIHEAGVDSDLHQTVRYFDFGDCLQTDDARCRRTFEGHVGAWGSISVFYTDAIRFFHRNFLQRYPTNDAG